MLFLNSNFKYQPIEFKFASTQKFHDPIDGERPVPYSIFRATYKEEVEFLENHPAYGNLFYRFNGNKIAKAIIKKASIKTGDIVTVPEGTYHIIEYSIQDEPVYEGQVRVLDDQEEGKIVEISHDFDTVNVELEDGTIIETSEYKK